MKKFSPQELGRLMKPEIGIKHPEYGYYNAPPPDFVKPAVVTPYVSVLGAQLRRRRAYSRLKWMDRLPIVEAAYHRIAQFSGWYSEYDVMEYAAGQTAQALMPLLHSDTDEGVPVGRLRKHVIRKPVVTDIVNQWAQFARAARGEATTQLPRDTNLGWPFPFSGRAGARPFVLGVLALAVRAQKDRGVTLAQTFEEMRRDFGLPMMLLGHRMQTSGKPMPVLDGSGLVWTHNMQSRARTIRPAPKLGVVYNKFNVSWVLKTAMKCPQHTQSRDAIAAKISRWKADGYRLVALDVSKFDKSHGGEYLVHAAHAFERVLGVKGLAEDLLEEVRIPLLFTYGAQHYQTATPLAPQLPSGISWTTICGLFWGDYICRVALDIAGLPSRAMADRYLNWGDDIVLALPASIAVAPFIKRLETALDLSLDEEPALKYLGMTYGSGRYEAAEGYSAYRLISKIWTPEIEKTGPTAFIGYAARLHFIPDPRKFHEQFLAGGWHPSLGAPTAYADIPGRLVEALRAVNEQPELYDYDELNFLLHGVSPGEGASYLEELGIDFDFESFLGGIDLTDPKKYIADEHPSEAGEYRTALKEIATKGVVALAPFARQFVFREKLRFEGGVVF